MFKWKIDFLFLILVATFVAINYLHRPDAESAEFVLAESHANDSYLFMQMIARGAYDYYNLHQMHIGGTEDLMEAGYTPYKLESSSAYSLVAQGTHVSCSIPSSSYFQGQMHPDLNQTGLDVSTMAAPGEINLPESDGHPALKIPSYSFDAQQFLPENYSTQQMDDAQRFIRLAAFMAAASNEYLAVNGDMPADIDDLEQFVGLERISVAWNGVNLVVSYDQVQQNEGNFFYGWKADGSFAAAIRLESDTFEYRWVSGIEGSRFGWNISGRTLIYP